MTTETYLAVPADGQSGAGILVLHAWWGLNQTFRDLCDHLAADGFVALAPDLYGDGAVATTVEQAEAQMEAAEGKEMRARAEAALDQLLAHPAVIGRQVGVIGFSMGAAWTLDLARRRPEVAAAVVFYGTMPGDFTASHAAFLGHFAAGDEWEPDEDVLALETSIRTAGREVEFHRYPGTRHWFFETDRPEYDAAAAELAWTRTLAFLR